MFCTKDKSFQFKVIKLCLKYEFWLKFDDMISLNSNLKFHISDFTNLFNLIFFFHLSLTSFGTNISSILTYLPHFIKINSFFNIFILHLIDFHFLIFIRCIMIISLAAIDNMRIAKFEWYLFCPIRKSYFLDFVLVLMFFMGCMYCGWKYQS